MTAKTAEDLVRRFREGTLQEAYLISAVEQAVAIRVRLEEKTVQHQKLAQDHVLLKRAFNMTADQLEEVTGESVAPRSPFRARKNRPTRP